MARGAFLKSGRLLLFAGVLGALFAAAFFPIFFTKLLPYARVLHSWPAHNCTVIAARTVADCTFFAPWDRCQVHAVVGLSLFGW